MTIAIALKIGDGLILGADSAVTLANPGRYPDNIYYNAEKIINLVKGLPLGAVTYGLGGFGGRSVTRLAKDLRQRLSDPQDPWWVDPQSFTVEGVAGRVKEFFYDGLYRDEFPHGGEGTEFDFIICGYGPKAVHGEVWAIDISIGGEVRGPFNAMPDPDGLVYRGQGEALNRLIRGWSEQGIRRLVTPAFPIGRVVDTIESVAPLWNVAMPIHDGIDLVRYLGDVTAGFARYLAEPATVVSPVDIATITFHEGFRWIARKHYYSPELNHDPRLHAWPIHHDRRT